MKLKLTIIIVFIALSFSCVEEFEFSTQTKFESILVVEATITNELKTQLILLSRTTPLEGEFMSFPESGATVNVKDNNSKYTFQETSSGAYSSVNPFSAKTNREYSLEITTSDGRMYRSTNMKLTQPTPIENLYVERGFNENDEEGVSIFIDAFNPLGNSKYYRFEYKETYKIIAPSYSTLELVPRDIDFGFLINRFAGSDIDAVIDFFVELRPRDEQEQICYNSVKSNAIIIAKTTNLNGNKLERFRIRFIKRDDFIISHRYSILVKQYIQSKEAHVHYETLKSFSNSENIFSENQVGFIDGNIFSLTNNQEKVIGFFDVSSVDIERVYFNYNDLFPNQQLPPYYINCDDLLMPLLMEEDPEHHIIRSPLLNALNSGQQFFAINDSTSGGLLTIRPFTLVLESCGDCTVLGNNVEPDFWID